MAEDNATIEIRNVIKDWISFDDEERELRKQIKALKDKKTKHSALILDFMRSNEVDNFALEGNGVGNISRSVRTSRPPLRRGELRTKLLMTFADEPQKVAEFLRSIEGIHEGEENMSAGGTQKELLMRRIPRTKTTLSMST
jgi:hypothetical protein